MKQIHVLWWECLHVDVPKTFSTWIKHLEINNNPIANQVIQLLEHWDIYDALEIYKQQEHYEIFLN